MGFLKRLADALAATPAPRLLTPEAAPPKTKTYLDTNAPAGTCQHRAVTGDPAWLIEVTCDRPTGHGGRHRDPRLGNWI